MKPQIGLMSQLSRTVLDGLRFAIKNNFDWYEIGLDWKQNYDLSKETINKINKLSQANNVRLIIHTPWYLPTSTMLPEIRKGMFQNIAKALMLAKKVGSDRLTIHPGYREMPGPAIPMSYESLINNLKKIVVIGKKHGVNICLENFDTSEYLLCHKLEDYSRVLKKVKGIKSTLDIGHTNTTKTKPFEYFKKVKNHVMDMHVHDNDGSRDMHACLGEGNIDFKKLFKECKKANYYGPFILELFPYENIIKGREKFLQIWKKA